MRILNRNTAGITKVHPIKVIQFGGGNFLRGFADWMIDLMNEKSNFEGSVQIILSVNKEMAKVMADQEGLYHVVTNGLVQGKPSREIRLITCIAGTIDPDDNYKEFLKSAENPDLQFIISNTTETGVAFNADDKSIDDVPGMFPGKLTALLFHKFKYLSGATLPHKVIILPCELLQSNGLYLREVILKYCNHWSLPVTFNEWIDRNIIFCNTLVDRIVPGFPKENAQNIKEEIGYDDKLLITAEPFHFWGIQPCTDNESDFDYVKKSFPAQGAGLDVKFVKDLTPYHTRKVRILNGAHTILTPIAYLCGLRFVKESIEHPVIGPFIKRAIFKEILPVLDMPEDEVNQFAQDVLQRFQNPFIKHELSSIALKSISKFKLRIIPSILTYQKINNRLPEKLMFSMAALICFYRGDWNGEPTPLNDTPEVIKFFKEVWLLKDCDLIAKKVLTHAEFWGEDLSKVPSMLETLAKDLNRIGEAEKTGSTLLSLLAD